MAAGRRGAKVTGSGKPRSSETLHRTTTRAPKPSGHMVGGQWRDTPSGIAAAELNESCPFCADLPHPEATHCRICHASWTRTGRSAHCPTCHRTFGSPTAFDAHLQSVGCADPATFVRRNGSPRFSEPRDDKWGTPTWRIASTGWNGGRSDDNEDPPEGDDT